MDALCLTQESALQKCLTEITRPEGGTFASVLLIGQTGTGKRRIARSIANALGISFVEIPLAGTATSIRSRLFGTQSECDLASVTEEAPGELANTSPSVFYLSRLDDLPVEMHQELHRLLVRRIYQDSEGRDWTLPNDAIIVGGLTDRLHGSVTREHWLVQQFNAEVTVTAPETPNELHQIVIAMLNEAESAKVFNIAPDECVALAKAAIGNLRRMRNWLQKATTTKTGTSPVDINDVWNILNQDAEHLLSQIEYTASTAHGERFRAWAAQFPNDLRGIPLKIVRHIRDNYYISPREFQIGIQSLVATLGLGRNSRVVFCNWQHLGRSAPIVTNALKNRGEYKIAGQIDLARPISDWPSPEALRGSSILLADDFAGSGRTIGTLFRSGGIMQALLNRYPGCKVKILLLAAYEDAIRELGEVKANAGDRIVIHVHKLLRSYDRCFTPDSRIFPTPEERDRMQEFCNTVAKKHYPKMSAKLCLGFDGVGSLFVFHNTVPNNTLPIIWYDRDESGWTPLFPARGLEDEMSD